MSLLNYGALVSHLVVIELLHDIQLTACIRDPKLGLERIPHILASSNGHIRVNNVLSKNTKNNTSKKGIDFLKSFLLCESKLSFRLAIEASKHLMVVSQRIALVR